MAVPFLALAAFPFGCGWVQTAYPNLRVPVTHPPHNAAGPARALWDQAGNALYYTGVDAEVFTRGERGLASGGASVCRVGVSPPYANTIVCGGRILALDWQTGEIGCLAKDELFIASSGDGKRRLSRPYPPKQVQDTRWLRDGDGCRLVVPSLSTAYLMERPGEDVLVWNLDRESVTASFRASSLALQRYIS